MVSVDPIQTCCPNAKWKWDKVSHLLAQPGELTELHSFARRLGLRQEWFQSQSDLPHYDLTPNKRRLAVALGVEELDLRQTVAVIREWREFRKESNQPQEITFKS